MLPSKIEYFFAKDGKEHFRILTYDHHGKVVSTCEEVHGNPDIPIEDRAAISKAAVDHWENVNNLSREN